MNKLYPFLFFVLIGVSIAPNSILAQCDPGTTGLAVIELEAPRLSDIEPLAPGEEYTFVFFYNYLFTSKGSDCIDESSVVLSITPPGAVDVINSPTIAGSFITVTISPNSSDFFIRISADDCSAETDLSCASLPIRELTVPVGYLSLDVRDDQKANGIVIDWSTDTEVNNDVFEIQRSNGSEAFVTIGNVDGAGTTSDITHYSFVDNNPIFGLNYYRLKQVDFNGAYSYSEMISAKYAENVDVVISPNPSLKGENIRVLVNAEENSVAKVSVYNIAGRLVKNEFSPVSEGTNVIEIDNDLAQGIYIVNVQLGTQSVTKRMVISQLRP